MRQLRIEEILPDYSHITSLTEGFELFERIGMGVRNLSTRTRQEYRDDLLDLIAFLEQGNVTALSAVRLSDLEAYQHALEGRGLTVSSRNRKTYSIKVFFRFLYEQELIHLDLASRLLPPPVERGQPRVLTETEYHALQHACRQNARDAAVIELYLQTGMTLRELARLTIGDIELPSSEGSGVARVRRRRGSVAYVPLNAKACNALVVYLAERPRLPNNWLFISRNRRALSVRAIQYLVEKYLRQIGIRDASVRTLRHTMATHHVARGTPLSVIQETLGYSSPEGAEVYVSLAKELQRKKLQENAL